MASRDVHTPEPVAPSRRAGISEMQKQALISNLQLEITERARKLRTQYALQAQGLRTRLEMRINRIPQALRKRTMQELFDEQTIRAQPAPAAPMPVMARIPAAVSAEPMVTAGKKSTKRKSEVMSTADDKENNQPPPSMQELANPKKRAKTTAAAATANTKASRTVSRKGGPTAVLSPRSHNSRTVPRSPIKSDIPTHESKTTTTALSRNAMRPTAAAARAASRQVASRNISATVVEHESRDSDVSNNSATTTIVKSSSARSKPKASTTTRSTATATAKPSRATAVRKATTAKRAESGTGTDSANETIIVSATTTTGGRKATTVTATTTRAATTGRSLRKRN